jgi:Flp pilus assembly pilin Flp
MTTPQPPVTVPQPAPCCIFAVTLSWSCVVMTNCVTVWCAIWLDRRAVTALEYAIIAGVLVATIVIGFNVFAGDLSNKFNNIANGI